VPPDLPLAAFAAHLAAALLVGGLIGGQREAAAGEHPGLRDFLLISLAGGVCGLLGNTALDAVALASIAGLLGVFHYEEREQRSGITTELAGVATFLLALLAASPQIRLGEPFAIAIAILIAAFLEAKQRLQHLLRETITESEFNATLTFVTLVLVIYPLLPVGSFGPYSFFSPREVWLFVILISSISYVGYFLEKFLGRERGLVYTSILGGLASTSASTLHFARLSKERPGEILSLLRGFLIANTVQFPRTFLLAVLVSPDLAAACAWPLALMTAGGLIVAAVAGRMAKRLEMQRGDGQKVTGAGAGPGNPFRLAPALRFGVLFTAVVFVSRAAAVRAGSFGFLGTSLLGGLVDVATIIAPAADLIRVQAISLKAAEIAVLAALASNAALKIGLAALAGTRAFCVRLALPYLVWGAAAAVGVWISLAGHLAH
jgi:uncharacterized membrane protein (DUF4010 family)